MAASQRIKALIEALNITIAGFERKIGVGHSAIGKIIDRNSDVKLDIVDKILAAYPHVSRTWLTTGKGDMFLPAGQDNDELSDMVVRESNAKYVVALGRHKPLRLTADEYATAFGDWQGLPMYNTPVTASFIATYRDETLFQPQYYLHDPRFRDCDFGAIITGDSMYSEIRHGDFIACKEITDRRFLVFGDIYYVVATNGLETCKYVNADPDNKDNLLLVPRNENISPSPIPKDMIMKMYKVRGIIRGY